MNRMAFVAFSKSSVNRWRLSASRQVPLAMALAFFLAGSAQAQLFQNLQTLAQSIPVGSGETDPLSGERVDGPRWVCAADFDLDGNQDFATCHLNGEIWVVGDAVTVRSKVRKVTPAAQRTCVPSLPGISTAMDGQTWRRRRRMTAW